MSSLKFTLKRKKYIRNVFDIALFFYFILNQLHYIFAFTGKTQFLVVSTINAIGIAMFIFIMLKKQNKKLLIFFLLYMLLGMLSFLFINNVSIITYITVLRYLGIAMYLLYYRQNPKVMTAIMYTTLILFSPVLIEKLGYNMFSKSSRNYYSILLLMVNFVYNKSFWDLKKKAPIFPTIASFFISLFAGGRGGIISLAVFLIGSIYKNLSHIKENPKSKIIDDLSDTREIAIITEEDIRKSKSLKNRLAFLNIYKKEILTILIITIIFSGIFTVKYLDKKYELFNFKIPEFSEVLEDNITDASYGFEGKALKSGARQTIITKYIGYMFSDVNYFIFGVKLDIEPFFEKYMFNLHNSYLGLHSRFGILGVILLGYLGFRSLVIMIKKKKWGHMLIYLSVLFRVAIDSAAFPGHLDIILFYYFFRFYDLEFKEIYSKNRIKK